MSKIRLRGERRLSLEECPVSYVTGDSVVAVEDFLVNHLLGGGTDLLDWTGRRVDAFALLGSELRKMEMNASD